MRIAYLTIDDVNLSVARELAEMKDGHIELRHPKDLGQAEDCEAILYDLDALPAPERSQVLARLT